MKNKENTPGFAPENKENTPGFVPGLDYDALHVRVNTMLAELWEIQKKFPVASTAWASAVDSRYQLGRVQDHILRVRGIRGN
jgi:uncharacterized protein YjiS (DUF1127 family)